MRIINLYHVEGIDGAGKTTFCKRFLDFLREQRAYAGETVAPAVLKFPTTYPERQYTQAEAVHSALFYMKDFSDNLLSILGDDKSCDHYVLDRSFVSTVVYQGFDREGWGLFRDYDEDAIHRFNHTGKLILDMCSKVFVSPDPDIAFKHLILHLDICPEIAYSRLKSRIRETRTVSDNIDRLILDDINEVPTARVEALNELSKLDAKYKEVIKKIGLLNFVSRNYMKTAVLNVNEFTKDSVISDIDCLRYLEFNKYNVR